MNTQALNLRGAVPDRLKYRGYIIWYWAPPIPVRDCDWHFQHEDFDGAPDGNDIRHGDCASPEECKQEIDRLIEGEDEDGEEDNEPSSFTADELYDWQEEGARLEAMEREEAALDDNGEAA